MCLDLLDILFGCNTLCNQSRWEGLDWVPAGLLLPLGTWLVRPLVVRKRMGIGPDHPRMNQCRSFPRAAMPHGKRNSVVRRHGVAAVYLFDTKIWKLRNELGYGPPGCLHLDGHRDGIAIVLDHEQHRELEIARRVHGLPKLAFARRSLTRAYVDDLVVLNQLVAIGNPVDPGVAQPRLGTSNRVEKLRARRTRRANYVQRFVSPVRRHLLAVRVRIVGSRNRRQQHLGGGHA